MDHFLEEKKIFRNWDSNPEQPSAFEACFRVARHIFECFKQGRFLFAFFNFQRSAAFKGKNYSLFCYTRCACNGLSNSDGPACTEREK